MRIMPIVAILIFSSCTYTVSLVHTQGEASDVIDETSSASAKVDPTLTIPASLIGK